jgi:hypothetical protein
MSKVRFILALFCFGAAGAWYKAWQNHLFNLGAFGPFLPLLPLVWGLAQLGRPTSPPKPNPARIRTQKILALLSFGVAGICLVFMFAAVLQQNAVLGEFEMLIPLYLATMGGFFLSQWWEEKKLANKDIQAS